MTLERVKHATGKRDDVFGSTNPSIYFHSILSDVPVTIPSKYAPPDSLMQQLDGHLNNMADVVNNKKVVLNQLTLAVASLTIMTIKQYSTIKHLLGDIKGGRSNISAAAASITATSSTEVNKLRAAIQIKLGSQSLLIRSWL